jgi:hypothetical protein
MKQNSCPLCGSKKLRRHEERNFGEVILGEKFSFNEVYLKCSVCHEEFDFSCETDKNYRKAEKKAHKKFVEKTIKELNDNGIKMSFFERVFRLPIRTLSRWKSGDFSFASLALLRIVKTYPWIIEVAEHKFEESFAKNIINQGTDNDLVKTGTSDNYDKLYTNSEIPLVETCSGC